MTACMHSFGHVPSSADLVQLESGRTVLGVIFEKEESRAVVTSEFIKTACVLSLLMECRVERSDNAACLRKDEINLFELRSFFSTRSAVKYLQRNRGIQTSGSEGGKEWKGPSSFLFSLLSFSVNC